MISYFHNYWIGKYNFHSSKATIKHYIETDEYLVIKDLIKEGYPCNFIGNATKTLFAFNYNKCVIIKYTKKLIKIKNNRLIADAGVSLKTLGEFALKNNIDGFEKIMTIPGLLGASIVNNVSFLNQEISKFLLYVMAIDKSGNIIRIKKNQINFTYRNSSLNSYFIFKAVFKIVRKNHIELEELANKAIIYRKKHQPMIKSLGSTFKNFGDTKAYELIALIKNEIPFYSELISKKHMNFISLTNCNEYINMVKLIESIQELIYNKKKILLENEIRILY